MKNKLLRQDLLNSFEELKDQFAQALIEAKNHDHDFEEIRLNFQQRLLTKLNNVRKNLPAENPMAEQVKGFLSLMEETNKTWNQKILKMEKGVGFRSNFNDSLLVFVYGKVKSGKSSLGNYIAWGNTDPKEIEKNLVPDNLKPVYFSHDQSGVIGGDTHKEAELRREFRVGATEATSSIQGFKISGLTWVDSPGLHSINEANGKLAEDYVDYADLILYTMKSDSPGRESDLNEIKDIVKKNKKILLLITGSDDVEEDWDDELDQPVQTVVMKNIERRTKQREYVRNALNEIHKLPDAAKNIDIVSFSARYAQLHENNPDKICDSGLGELFGTLDSLINADGVRIKQQVPMNNFKNFLESCMEDLKPYHLLINDLESPIAEVKESIPIKVKQAVRKAQESMRNEIDLQFENLISNRSDQNSIKKNIHRIQNTLEEKLNNLITDSLSDVFMEVMQDFRNSIVDTYQASDLVKLPEFKIETAQEQIPSSISSGTRKRNSGVGGLLGAGVGFLIAGPAGAAIGGIIGSAGGGMSGRDANVNTRTIEITTGDNLLDIKKSAMKTYTQTIEHTIHKLAEQFLTAIVSDAQQLAKDLALEISTVEKDLANINNKIRNKLN